MAPAVVLCPTLLRRPSAGPANVSRTACAVTFRVRDVIADQETADFLERRDIFVLSIDGELMVGFRRERIDAGTNRGGEAGLLAFDK
jgi:hypothetical protein